MGNCGRAAMSPISPSGAIFPAGVLHGVHIAIGAVHENRCVCGRIGKDREANPGFQFEGDFAKPDARGVFHAQLEYVGADFLPELPRAIGDG